jgi:hypothetical protein
MTTTTPTTPPESTTPSIWIVQQQCYYYSDEYCVTVRDPDGWFTTELAAKTHCFKKNMGTLEEFASDYDDGCYRRFTAFLALPEEEQFAALMSSDFNTEDSLGIPYDYNLRWYEVVKLDCLG